MTAGADDDLEALKRKMGLIEEEAPPVATRVDAEEEDDMSEEEMAELEEALDALKSRELGA